MKGWKTVLFNVAMAAVASPEVLALIPPKQALYIVTFGNLFLRAITTTPIGKGGNSEASRPDTPTDSQ